MYSTVTFLCGRNKNGERSIYEFHPKHGHLMEQYEDRIGKGLHRRFQKTILGLIRLRFEKRVDKSLHSNGFIDSFLL